MQQTHPTHGEYTLRVDEASVHVRFHTDDYLDHAHFPLTEDRDAVLVPRDARTRFIDVLEENGFEVGYNGYF